MKQRYALLFAVGLTIMLLFVSCQSEAKPSSETSAVGTITNTTPPESLLASITPSPLPPDKSTTTVEVISSVVPDTRPSATAIPTATLPIVLVTSTPTLTPLPTLVGEELESAVGELLTAPMNCDVPCWWGAIPGVTSLDEIKHAISPYNFDIYESVVDEQLTILRLGIGYIEERNDFEVRIGYGFSNSILTTVSAYSPSVFEVLARYDRPDEVWLETMGFEREGDLPVRLNLVYLQAGMAVGYVADGDIQDDMVIGCFADEEIGRLRLIIPNTATSYEDFPTIFEEDRSYLPLDEATGLTMEDFMQHFSDPTQPLCIETPAELWE